MCHELQYDVLGNKQFTHPINSEHHNTRLLHDEHMPHVTLQPLAHAFNMQCNLYQTAFILNIIVCITTFYNVITSQ